MTTAMLNPLSTRQKAKLRGLVRVTEDIDWPAQLARTEGWRVANDEYHRRQRDLGRQEMRALMAALRLGPGMDPDRAKELVRIAVDVFLQTDAIRVVSRVKDGELRLYATRCPLYERFRDHGWGGLTACGCFARHQGWFDALDAGLEEDLRMNRKWGDPVCQVVIREMGRRAA